ncbi:MAG: hypothetical protein KDB14_23490 [Planctomycetales bacterium]|nr:hypothetical protein [Planctomycetales bacterium]
MSRVFITSIIVRNSAGGLLSLGEFCSLSTRFPADNATKSLSGVADNSQHPVGILSLIATVTDTRQPANVSTILW